MDGPLITARAAASENGLERQLVQPEEEGGAHDNSDASCSNDAAAAAVAVSSDMWICLAVSVAIGLASGSQYGFGRYVRALKETLGLTQAQAARLGALLDAGNYLGHPVTGWVYDRVGPRASCSLAALLVGAAYGGIQRRVNHGDGSPPAPSALAVLGAAFFVVGFGSGLGYIAALGSTSKQFSDTAFAGRAVGAVAAGFGLSGTLVALTYRRVDLGHFFTVWALLVAAVNVVGAAGLKNPSRNDSGNGNPAPANVDQDSVVEIVGLAPVRRPGSGDVAVANESILQQEEEEPTPHQSYQRLQPSSSLGSPGPVEPLISRNTSDNNNNLSWTSWKRFDFWLLFLSFACLTGCGLFLINNVATIVQSFRNDDGEGGGGDSLAGDLVILCSVCNCAGRLGMGVLVDKKTSAARRNISLMQSAAFVMSAGMAVTATTTAYTVHHGSGDTATTVGSSNVTAPLLLSALAVTVALTAASYGAVFVVIVAIITERFGSISDGGRCANGRHFGKDYGLILVGSALFGTAGNALSAWMYQQQLENSGSSNGGENAGGDACLGAVCYQGSFLLATVIASCGALPLQVLKLQQRPQG